MDTNTTINKQLLAQLVDCLNYNSQFNPNETEEQKKWQQHTNTTLSAVGQTLAQAFGSNPQSTAGNFGEHVVDGTRSTFL